MNCPKKKNSVNTNKSNIIWEKLSALHKFHGGKVPPGPDKPPALPVHQGYTQQKKEKFFKQIFKLQGGGQEDSKSSSTHINSSKQC